MIRDIVIVGLMVCACIALVFIVLSILSALGITAPAGW